MENKKELLKKLIKRNEELKPLVFKSFKTEKELDNYSKNIQKEIDEYYDNQDQIRQLEYELKTPEEKKEYDEYLRKLKLKSEGKPLI
ncbi:hypothetical protein [Elizabethkingia anophelis]|uniref:hypothetical protein n=1 Tax=Elizabethkingia anophelis TaxID=1117645 RepID=UPI0004E457D1|nr:hypothetical protein [Elizabethkingia anophelis]KFC40122.1 hypothetical protein FF18_00345 [Elizabethkingia anophelis]MCT3789094.1 hypothetical protein [Elizabethkingia anophelis]MCT4288213.1 hypothetical protein [Elizabethkingia anophelis]MDV2448933.1 hypothetical protein [Elizabethkingia anophelis]OPC28576.1 hypothetical protein BAX98_14595 [Elizabethkingia anophelis]